MVVSRFPGPEADGGRIKIGESLASPELLVIDPMTAFYLAILLRASRLDVAVANPQCLHGQGKSEGELVPVVALELADPERKRPTQLSQERKARALVQPTIEPQERKPRAVIEGSSAKRYQEEL
jgi:transposase